MAKLSLGRRQDSGSAIRESTAMTTVYLLEMNQKFEAYIRQKVEELEVRVAAQQARTSTAEVEADEEAWLGDEMPAEEASATGEQISFADFSLAEPEPEAETEVTAEPLPEAVPDYMALLGGNETEDDEEAVAGDQESLMLEEETVDVETAADPNGVPEPGEETEADQELPENNEEVRGVDPEEASETEAGDLIDEAEFVPTPGLLTTPQPATAPDESLSAEAETDAAEDEAAWELPLPEGEKDEWA
jgi:hypothetical protein